MNEVRETESQEKRNSVAHGVVIGLAILVFHIPLVFVFIGFFPGIVQWLAVGPLLYVWGKAGRRESMKGLLIMAGITMLINAACCGIMFGGGSFF